MRLIDADATIKYLREFICKDCDRRKCMKNGKVRFCYEIGDVPCRACDIDDTIDYFLEEDISPTIDAIIVVRCKDCKFWYKDECSHLCKITGDLHPANWFCADGERRSE